MAPKTRDDDLKTFSYEAIAPNGTRIKGKRAQMAAYSADAVRRELADQGFIPIVIKERSNSSMNVDIGALLSGKGADAGAPKMKLGVLTDFTRSFHELLKAGISVPRAFATMAEDAPSAAHAELCHDLSAKVSSGSSLADAFSTHPRVFDDVYIAYIAAGEQTGSLVAATGRLADLFQRRSEMRTKVKSVAIYPALIGGVISVLVLGIMLFLVPRFEEVYSSFGGELPGPTQKLISFSRILPLILGPLALAVVGLGVWLSRESKKSSPVGVRWNRIRFRIPIIGSLYHSLALHRWLTTLGGALDAGLRLPLALELAADASSSAWVRSLTPEFVAGVESGRPLSDMVSQHPALFPPNVRTMVATGEQTGELPKMLESAASALDSVISGKVATVGAQLEVALLVVMGVVVGGLLIVLYLPILSLSSSIGESFEQ